MRLGALDGLVGGKHGEHMAHAIVAIDDSYRTGIHHKLRCGLGLHHAVADAVEVPTQAQHAMRLMAP